MENRKGLSSNILKIIAITAMLTDHIAWAFVEFNSPAGILMHTVGRLTAPIMCFFIAEGYYHTRSIKKYMLRLLCFALISHIPFSLFLSGKIFDLQNLNVMYTLLIGLCALWACKNLKDNISRVIAVIICCIAAMPADWEFIGVLFVLAFGLNRGNFKKQALWFSTIAVGTVLVTPLTAVLTGTREYFNLSSAVMLGVLLAIPVLSLYNGKRGGFKGSKWIFYFFYPAHLLAIALFKML